MKTETLQCIFNCLSFHPIDGSNQNSDIIRNSEAIEIFQNIFISL